MKTIEHWIDGEYYTGNPTGRFGVEDPATGEIQAELLQASDADLDHAVEVAVHGRHRLIIGDGSDGRGRVGADARQLAQAPGIARKASAVLLNDDARSLVQVARPGVISQPLPGL